NSWMKTSPGFNLDKVDTPVWIAAHGGTASLLWHWEWFAGLTRLGKPVELLYLPKGQHELRKPAERALSLEGNVHWLSFWLQRYEDPSRAKRAQYGRWEKLCDSRTARSGSEALPRCLGAHR